MFCLNTTENLAKNLCFCIIRHLVSRLAIWPTGVGPKCSTRNESVKKYPTALGVLQMIHVLFPLAVDAHMLAHTHVRTHTCAHTYMSFMLLPLFPFQHTSACCFCSATLLCFWFTSSRKLANFPTKSHAHSSQTVYHVKHLIP